MKYNQLERQWRRLHNENPPGFDAVRRRYVCRECNETRLVPTVKPAWNYGHRLMCPERTLKRGGNRVEVGCGEVTQHDPVGALSLKARQTSYPLRITNGSDRQ